MFVLFGSIRRPMAASLESFRKLLDWIDRMVSVPGNEPLRAELQRRYGTAVTVAAAPSPSVDEFSSFIRLQRTQLRAKARQYYQDIPSARLRNELVEDYAEMLWYRYIGDIPQMFAHINFQVENMMNYYAHHTQAFKKVAENPTKYHLIVQLPKWKTDIQCKDGFTKVTSLNLINLKTKYAYWCIESGLPQKEVEKIDRNIHAICQLRNYNEHRNTVESQPKTLESLQYWEKHCDNSFGYLLQILDRMKQSCVTLTPIAEEADE